MKKFTVTTRQILQVCAVFAGFVVILLVIALFLGRDNKGDGVAYTACKAYSDHAELRTGEIKEIHSSLEKALEAQKSGSYSWRRVNYYLGLSYLEQGQFDEAIDSFTLASKKGKKGDYLKGMARLGICDALTQKGLLEDAYSELKSIWAKDGTEHPVAPRVLFNLFVLSDKLNKSDEKGDWKALLNDNYPDSSFNSLCELGQ